MAERQDRYFFVPDEAVAEVVAEAKTKRAVFVADIKKFLADYKASLYWGSDRDDGHVIGLWFYAKDDIPKGWRITQETWDNKTERLAYLVMPDKRTKSGKAATNALKVLNMGAISVFAELNAAAKKYGLDISMCIQHDRYGYGFYGSHIERIGGYLFAVPVGDMGGLKEDYVVSPDIREVTKSKFINIREENGTLDD